MKKPFEEIITQDNLPILNYDTTHTRNEAREQSLKHDHLLQLAPRLSIIVGDLARVIASASPCKLPMSGTSYTHKEHLLWEPYPLGRCMPVVTIPMANIYWSPSSIGRDDNDIPVCVTGATVTMPVVCEPSWYTFKRWSTVLIDDFYAAMRAIRRAYDVKWRDVSKVETEYSWDNLEFRYNSKAPVWTLEMPIPPVKSRYGDEITRHCSVRVNIQCRLQIPTPPEEERNAPGCHVVEEQITETKTKKIRRMKCD
jgi:hypothetical protein